MPSADFDATDPLFTALPTYNTTYTMPFSYTRLCSCFLRSGKAHEATWRRGILKNIHRLNLRADYHCFFTNLIQSHYFNFRLRNVLYARYRQKIESHKDTFKCYPLRSRLRRNGKIYWTICGLIHVCEWHCRLLHFPENWHYRTPASGRYKPSVSFGSEEWIFHLLS
jgi:hypothetical protein